MMNIEILNNRKFSASGEFSLKAYQNVHSNLLDLLVREAIQNGVDAGDALGGPGRRVTMRFNIGKFDRGRFNAFFEGVSETLDKRFIEDSYDYISIADKSTTGLTGNPRDPKSNFYKLLYSIGRNDKSADAGGSMGLGKTVYNRTSEIGMAVYYSRIQLDNGNYEERLAACMMERDSEKPIIPSYSDPDDPDSDNTPLGIALWGRLQKRNTTLPCIDPSEIKQFLEIFNIEPYCNTETGTIVIIPYIDKGKLLLATPENNMPAFHYDIEKYIRMSVQRWYYPRLQNKTFRNGEGKYLRVIINRRELEYQDMHPLFQLGQSLYNRAAVNADSYEDFISDHNIDSEVLDIKPNKVGLVGKLAYAKVKPEILDDGPIPITPYQLQLLDVPEDRTDNPPILSFCRKPGMIINRVYEGSWLTGSKNSSPEEYIIAIFVLNSSLILPNEMSLEEYVRSKETGDHLTWEDITDGYITKIQKGVARKMAGITAIKRENDEPKQASGLSRLLAKELLPTTGFGRGSSHGHVAKPEPGASGGKNVRYIIKSIQYKKDKVEITYGVTVRKSAQSTPFGMKVMVSSTESSIKLEDWKEIISNDIPFEVENILVSINKVDKEKKNNTYIISKDNPSEETDLLTCELIICNDIFCGIKGDLESDHDYEMDVTLTLQMNSYETKPLIQLI